MSHSIFSFRTLVYLVYAMLLTVILLYVRFPAEKFKEYCVQRIDHLLPGSTCTIDRITYRFPLTAALETITLSRTIDGQESATVMDQLLISPEPMQFWRTFILKGRIYSGLFGAALDFDRRTHSFKLENIHIEGLQAGDFAQGIGITERKISGVVEFSGDYQAQKGAPGEGTGKGLIQVKDGSLDLLQPILALNSLQFDTLAVKLTHEKGTVRFAEGELVGQDISADFTGDLRLASPFLDSNILLSGHLQPDDNFLRGNPQQQLIVQRLLQRYRMTVLPFKVGGTVQRPLFRFST